MNGIRGNEPNVTINACAGVPARSWLARVVSPNDDHVVLSEIQMAGQIVAKTDIAIGTCSKVETVDPNVTVGHYAVEFDREPSVSLCCVDGKMLSIPSNARRQKATRAACRIFRIEWPLNAPIMWNIKLSPRRIVKSRRFCISRVTLEK